MREIFSDFHIKSPNQETSQADSSQPQKSPDSQNFFKQSVRDIIKNEEKKSKSRVS